MSDELRVTDAMWQRIEAMLADQDPPKRLGRKRSSQRRVAEALAHRLATGCPWNKLPPAYGDDGTAHRTVQRWRKLGIYDEIVAVLTGGPETGATA